MELENQARASNLNTSLTIPHKPNRSVNLGRFGQRLFQLFQGEGRAPGDLKDRRLAPAAELGSLRDLGRDVEWDYDRAMAIGMDKIPGTHQHSGHTNFAAEAVGVNKGMRRSD